jgi:hypothetical protein
MLAGPCRDRQGWCSVKLLVYQFDGLIREGEDFRAFLAAGKTERRSWRGVQCLFFLSPLRKEATLHPFCLGNTLSVDCRGLRGEYCLLLYIRTLISPSYCRVPLSLPSPTLVALSPNHVSTTAQVVLRTQTRIRISLNSSTFPRLDRSLTSYPPLTRALYACRLGQLGSREDLTPAIASPTELSPLPGQDQPRSNKISFGRTNSRVSPADSISISWTLTRRRCSRDPSR